MNSKPLPLRAPRVFHTASRLGACVTWIVAAILCGAPAGFAQGPPKPDAAATPTNVAPPAFEVVSVRESRGTGIIRIMNKANGFECTNITLKDLIAQAYGVHQNLIFGVPPWAEDTRFNIDAKIADEDMPTLTKLTQRQRSAMVVPLLADRFHVQAHQEVHMLPIYELVVDTGGPKLKVAAAPAAAAPETEGGPPPKQVMNRFRMSPGQLSASPVTISMILNQLTYTVHRTVVDKTGLTGRYDIELKWTPEERSLAGADPGAEDQAGSIFTALREQLGLRLVPSKGPVETLVVDHLERPSEN